jgi:hypothetical protein
MTMTKPLTGYEKEIAILHAEARLDAELIEEFKGEAHEYKQAIERVRKIHTPFWLDEPHCSECHSYEVDENYAIYPCPTIRALDGETDEA